MRANCWLLVVVLFSGSLAQAQALRVLNGNVCGSGSVCGFDAGGAYVLTNAHVAGTRPGTQMKVEYASASGKVSQTAVHLMAAYSDQTLSDWAILRVAAIKDGARWPLSTTAPTPGEYYTTGSPRCVWPLVSSTIRSVEIGEVLWRWQPNAIGGQSGSSVRTQGGVTKGLLTWSWGGLGAGQTTRSIYRSVVSASVDPTPRPPGLIEVADGMARAQTESGFFALEGELGSVQDLPIWDIQVPPPPPPPPPPDDLRAAIEAAGLDYEKFVRTVLSLLDLLAE